MFIILNSLFICLLVINIGIYVITRLIIVILLIQPRIVIYWTTSSDNLLGALKIHRDKFEC
jgi:hypothetical protein